MIFISEMKTWLIASDVNVECKHCLHFNTCSVESAKLTFHPKSNHVHVKLMVQRFAVINKKIKGYHKSFTTIKKLK